MWIATKVGFFSIVRKDKDEYHVRARVCQDLTELMELAGVECELFESKNADYRFRLVIDQETLEVIGAKLFAQIDYGNFKNRILESDTQCEKANA